MRLQWKKSILGNEMNSVSLDQNQETIVQRHVILDNAFRCFQERGYVGLSMRELTAATATQEMDLEKYFGGKFGLAEAVLFERIYPILYSTWVEPLLRENEDPIEAFINSLNARIEEAAVAGFAKSCFWSTAIREAKEAKALELKSVLERVNLKLEEDLREALAKAQGDGRIKSTVRVDTVAKGIVQAVQKSVNIGQTEAGPDYVRGLASSFASWLRMFH